MNLDGLGTVADLANSFFQSFRADAELLAPVAEFVLLANVDALTILPAILFQVALLRLFRSFLYP